MNILVINGPNTNMFGAAQIKIFGNITLGDIENKIKEAASGNAKVSFFQSNHEGAIIDRIHRAYDENIEYIIINAGAYAHTSIAIRDAFLATNIPFIEVRMSNVYAREDFRSKSYLSDIALGVITGFGDNSYILALAHLLSVEKRNNN
ncbi:type II 3-dehydroquinate dehydratase [Brachyspira hampsonii]|uniref:3-dehydroquinate dehydratase n=1 Tax=Brachyspira hampsonii TaxID=1287055 RepID=A0A1E5NFR9_9SPIR|nr:type II 3-dehydroquinate dehydratase [Brachyspira hampsonii]OEJ14981.1 type II 3-dehydroquinate dehydratase [Brachyspira hampsonii]